MTIKLFSAALAALLLVGAASVAQATPHRSHHAARAQTPGTASSSRPGYQTDDVPWTFACIKDHGTSRCNDLN
jgi:invasion protein IalB